MVTKSFQNWFFYYICLRIFSGNVPQFVLLKRTVHLLE